MGLSATTAATSAGAQTVSNVATAQWSVDGKDFTVDSNLISFEINQSSARLTTLTPMPGGPENVDLSATYCSSATAAQSTRRVSNSSGGMTSLIETGQIRVGQRLVIRIDAAFGNRDPNSAETLRLRLVTPQGDEETLTALEDGPDSGRFYASIGTIPFPPSLVRDDCRLSLEAGETINVAAFVEGQAAPVLFGSVDALADPFGVVFDSLDGRPVDGARVTLIDVATSQPADVFAFDGVTPYPSSLISGSEATDANGDTYPFAPGEYRFPLIAFGEYRLSVDPPSPYTAPSDAPPSQLATLLGPDGQPFEIVSGSYGEMFTVDSLIPLQVDIPIDAPGGMVTISKRASREIAQAGDAVFFTITLRNRDPTRPTRDLTLTDSASASLRLRSDSLRLDRQRARNSALTVDNDGHGFSLTVGSLAGGETRRVTYAMTIRPDAPPGDALNRATISAPDGNIASAQANIRILRDGLTDRMTIIGRVVDGGCNDPSLARGIPGIRVMMEDGAFAITDIDGRYHFDGVVPGNHVVQAAPVTLPQGGEFVDCARSTRSSGSAWSRLVSGQGGSLVRVDFVAILPEGTVLGNNPESGSTELTDQAASGAENDWLALGDGPNEFLFPAMDHNPRSPSIRVAIRHRQGQTIALTRDGKAVDPLSFEGVKNSRNGHYSVSVWRGVGLDHEQTNFRAEIINDGGSVAEVLERAVHFSNTPFRAEIIREQSNLVADGVTRPVMAVRFVDRNGRPVHSGISGTLTLDSPYQVASAIEARQQRALTGFGNASATWTVQGDNGIALIELAPTMVSGALRAIFNFGDGEVQRREELESWIEPGDQPWTLVGIAEGSIGARNVAENMQRDGANGSGGFDSDLGDNARVAFYAKGRVLGEYLLTVAYDSAKQSEDQNLLGTIDPAAYYTIYGDGSERLFDAASREKLYVRIESSAFYALFGDFETGFDQTTLARYLRTVTGVKAEARLGAVRAEAFVAKVGSRQRRDEFQGNGLTGPYALSSRSIIANSENVAIEVRDRLRSELILERRELVRFVDYDIDLLSGTIRFAEPVLSRDAALNPRFVIVNYEVDNLGGGEWNGGLRASWTSENGKLRIGATGLTDKGDGARNNLGAVDVELQIGEQTELRAEAGFSNQDGNNAAAFLAEVEHHSGPVDLLAYVRQVDEGYGVGQQNLAERGRRKVGVDARVQVAENWTLIARAWHDESLTDTGKRKAAELRAAWRTKNTDAYIGIAHIADNLADGRNANSTVLEGGVTQRLLGNRLELSAASSIALSDTNSIDLPTRHRLGVRYAITSNVKAVAIYEIARGDAINANTLRGGLEITPWTGGTIVSTVGREALGVDSDRTFAAFTIGQSMQVGERLILDATLDANRTLAGGIAVSDVINPAQPVSSGGQLGQLGSLGEDFTAVTLGAAWSAGPWNARARGEYRDGEFANRKGLTLAAIRQLVNGSVAGGGVTWTRADGIAGSSSEVLDAAFSFAHRPQDANFQFLSKLEYRSDAVTGAIAGQAGPAGQTALIVDGDAKSRRLIASFSGNWTPTGDEWQQRTEIGFFTAVRHNFDRFEGFDLSGTTLIGGIDARIGLGERIEIGGRATVRHNLDTKTTSFAVGPEIGFVPADNMLVSVGYNVIGFRDPDFSGARVTDEGLFASIRLKFDADSFSFLGRGR